MSTLSNPLLTLSDDYPRASAVSSALAIAVVATVCGILATLAVRSLAAWAGVADTDAFRVFGSGIQVGFAAFAGLYLYWASDYGRYVRLSRPAVADIGWVLAQPLAFVAAGEVLWRLRPLVGLPQPVHEGGTQALLAATPSLWLVAFVGLYLIAAPAEELVFRGIVQGRLRPQLSLPALVVVSASAFALLHVFLGLLSTTSTLPETLYWGVETFIGGAVFDVAYERPENLAVPAVGHAMMWTVPFGALVPV
jgi:membrane protease YdiL (CAAX protease family)